ncbi:toll/interleukin-1 receptor domain-containing protein [Nocardiopsis xinjiangensis]|uniref:toll/interleukin-1 receptor domain-containing protein n=1 Tax=Nocardiopsis xinjiangensis TaxID=124285 RepID=UPI000348845F|nr:toll/interleukin-1 receptor domain-containing protein [Nocardiopsis xinjiangensis]
MHTCFVNYRTGDGEHVATLLSRELSAHFGGDEVFLASRSIGAGDDFEQGLERALARCEVLFAVIGRDWLDLPGPGGRALEDPADWTRYEIASVLETGVVVPVLVDGAPRIRPEQLPEDVRGLARCQYRRFYHRNAEADLEQIVEAAVVAAPHLEEAGHPEPERAGAETSNTAGDVHGVAVQAREYTNHGVSGVGGNIGPVVSGTRGPVSTGSGAQYNNSQVHNGQGNQNNHFTGRSNL